MATDLTSENSITGNARPTPVREKNSSSSEPLEEELESYAHTHNYFIFKLPGLRNLNKHYLDAFRKLVRDQISLFQSLKCLSEEEKKRILPYIKHSLARIYSYETWWELDLQLNLPFAFLALLGVGIALFGGMFWLFNRHSLANGWIITACVIVFPLVLRIFISRTRLEAKRLVRTLNGVSIAVSFAAILWLAFYPQLLQLTSTSAQPVLKITSVLAIVLLTYALSIIYGTIAFRSGLTSRFQVVVFMVISLTLLYLLISSPDRWGPPILRDTLVAFFVAANASTLLVILFSLPFALLEIYVKRRKASKYPEDEITESLCSTLTYLETHPERWRDTEFRKEIIQGLNWIENRIRSDFFKLLVMDSDVSKEWLTHRLNDVSFGFAQMSRQALLPNENTRHMIIKKLATHLVYAAERNWGKFESQIYGASPSWQSKVSTTLFTVARIALPFVLLGLIRSIPDDLIDPQTKNSIATAATSFAILNVLYTINPKLADVLGTNKPENKS